MQEGAAKTCYRVGCCTEADIPAWGTLTAAGFSHRDGERGRLRANAQLAGFGPPPISVALRMARSD